MNCNILVDSCSYFRLAQSIHPLLKRKFCEEKYSLGVISELNEEYKISPTLKHKFHWVDQKEYQDNRKRCFSLKAAKKTEINNAFYFIRETAREEGFGVSRIDLIALSHSYILGIPIVTDDSDMLLLAKEYEIKTFTSLQLLKTLLDCGVVTLTLIRTIASYWAYLNDTPKSYRKDYKNLFNENAPS